MEAPGFEHIATGAKKEKPSVSKPSRMERVKSAAKKAGSMLKKGAKVAGKAAARGAGYASGVAQRGAAAKKEFKKGRERGLVMVVLAAAVVLLVAMAIRLVVS